MSEQQGEADGGAVSPAVDGMDRMGVVQLLAELRRRDVLLWVEGGQLKCSAKAGAMNAELRDLLGWRKSAILDFLRAADALAKQQPAVVPLQQKGSRPPVFAVGGHNGDVFTYRRLVQHLGPEQPFYGLQPPGLDGKSQPLDSVEGMATYFAGQIRAYNPVGPLVIGGFCAGGTVAIELARQLQAQGAKIGFLALFGCPYATWFRSGSQLWSKMRRIPAHAATLAGQSWAGRRAYVAQNLRGREVPNMLDAQADSVRGMRENLQRVTLQAVRRYEPALFDGRLALFLPSRAWVTEHAALKWRKVAAVTDEYAGPTDSTGDNMLMGPNAAAFAALFQRAAEIPTVGAA